MATVLFLFILIIYIGLGVPDSALGSAWPAIYPDLAVNVGLNSLLTFIISFATVGASFFSAKIINRLGTPMVTGLSTLLSGVALLGYSLSESFWLLCLLSIPLGLAAGAIDAALNNYVASRYGSMQMNFLHVFYGLGVAITPYVFSFALKNANNWRLGYEILFFIQLALSLLTFATLPLWKRVQSNLPEEQKLSPKTLSVKELLHVPALKSNWLLFFSTCALEFTVGTWGCTYLVTCEGLTESHAAVYLTLYYAGMMASRFISAFVCKRFSCGAILCGGWVLTLTGIVALFLPIPPNVKGVSFLLISLGNGPTFPNLISQTPKVFGREISQSIIGTQMATCNMGIMIAPPIFGVLAGTLGLESFPYFVAVWFVLMACAMLMQQRSLKITGKSLFTIN